MILMSARLSKNMILSKSIYHNTKCKKNKNKELNNSFFYVNENKIIRQDYARNENNTEMYKSVMKDIKNEKKNIEKVRKEKRLKSLRKDINLNMAMVLTFGASDGEDFDKYIRELDQNDKSFGFNIYRAVNEVLRETGLDTNVKMFLHRDETSLHFHFDFLTYSNKLNKSLKREFNPKFCSDIQTKIALKLQNYNYDINRGISKKSKVIEYLNEVGKGSIYDLTKEEKRELFERRNIKNQTLQEYKQKQIEELENLKHDISKKKIENQDLEKKISSKDGENKYLDLEISDKKEKIRKLENEDYQRIKQEIYNLEMRRKELYKDVKNEESEKAKREIEYIKETKTILRELKQSSLTETKVRLFLKRNKQIYEDFDVEKLNNFIVEVFGKYVREENRERKGTVN
ncbi:hypothetical protein [Aliarcobacter butzleri]|uniref:hypothetical protein n=1 Tax=Aliarcobacter butzleri TaxID=28197 RepID=UPI0021B42289|nr:hypothetical protein [Aliarcobacter butzleri]MCT7633308.1 hypothetical protein [Aliarcobacter butzleri]